ncbi:trehalose operon repressor TreR [Yersinia ruckeri]|uniref:trehalose operon repressor TreR n=1 Tax=Yersinia ruckeri TaxID=29486 RepID=UPI0011A0E51E|nr:trehalose operon repressor TreR [Yersinia ruckeri]EKN3346058.1 HTH-type transcriptional regulator TreR [Yersinia ruckeri]EKN3362259.1 HTH-type transcriptional regulator TreR [Yersinia ruckeri]EKN4201938.1 HTH-type transcriptional regulator TreR [Yersinia ruckeri]EKN4207962.1 HTH-type transcriptional regulator TreR [Yersinia ruckeri]EKN4698831.1 HTH-type transcriptional regulator TreR [Yersinia ruckeri]
MQSRLTIKDIARMSGVGKSTVSRVLNNEGSVSPQTRDRVEAVIRQHGFTPSKSARAMRGHSDKVVGIIVSRLDSPSENQAVRTMLPLFYQQGYDPILMESQFDAERVTEHLNILRQRNVDGVIVFGFTGLSAEMLIPWQEKLVVLAREYPGFSSVCYDDDGAVSLLMDKLRKAGHQHISYIGVQSSDATTGMRRYQSYLNYCQRHGLTPTVTLGELSYQSGFQQASQVIKPDTSALVCASDTIALGVNKYLQQQGKQHIQVCGIGNTPLLNFLFPSSFSVELGYGSAGVQAAQQLLGQLNNGLAIQQIIIPGKLI